jgi:hypothetical protein
MVNLGLGDMVEGHKVGITAVRQFVRRASCECGWWFQGESRRVSAEREMHLQEAIVDGARLIRRHERGEAP